jgi:phage major head subunit gpT-like protein
VNIVITPQVIRRIEDNIEYLLTDAWRRRREAKWWERLMKKRTASSKREILQWMLQTAKIKPIGNGGNYDYEDITEVHHEILVERFGTALRLDEDEIEDSSALDRAGQWATQIGGYAAEWPQIQATSLIKNGKTNLCYDGLSFFNTAHPVNHYIGASGGTYANLFYDFPFSPSNLARAYRLIAGIKAPDGLYRKLKPRVVAAGELERLRVVQALGAEFYADPVRASSTATAQNMIKVTYGFEEPVIDPEFDETGATSAAALTADPAGGHTNGETRGVWYLGCELVEDDTLGGLIYSERKPFSMNTYSHVDDVTLAHLDAFEWKFKGRNGATYGHPFLFFRFEPNAA